MLIYTTQLMNTNTFFSGRFVRTATFFGLLTGLALQAAAPPTWHQMISSYEGSQTCLRCHASEAEEVMATTHWTWEHTDPKTGKSWGKNNVINNYCVAVASNEPRCTSCHVGVGYANQDFDFRDPNKVDCLVCHDTTGTYKKFPTGAGHPVYDTPKEFPAGSGVMWPPPDLTYIAQNAGLTSRATCGACHFYGGGGDAVKHGDLDSTLTNPSRQLDVHMAADGRNFSCTACHQTHDHDIPGSRYLSEFTGAMACGKCHTGHNGKPHASDRLNAHTARVACQTCHIPEFARGGRATKMTWDWSTAGEKTPEGKNKVIKDSQGNAIYDTQKGTFTWEANVIPEYRWFNGEYSYVTVEDTIDPAQLVNFTTLGGGFADPNSLLVPVKRFTGRQPYDAVNHNLVIPHLFGSDTNAYWKAYDWELAVSAGMDYVKRPYSGELGWVDTEMYWVQNHMVAPKEQALGCADCHTPRSRLNFATLGYPAEQAARLQTLAGFEIDNVQLLTNPEAIQVSWTMEPGFRYQVQTSPGLTAWSDVPDGQFTADTAGEQMWKDVAPSAGSTAKFYRILRSSQ